MIVGHVHLKVADLDRSLRFWRDVVGFEVQARRVGAVFLGWAGYHHHIALNTWTSLGGPQPAPGTTGLFHVAVLYPDRAALGAALRRAEAAGHAVEGAADHGVSEAVYLSDPDGNGVEFYHDRPRAEWVRGTDGLLALPSRPLDLAALRAA